MNTYSLGLVVADGEWRLATVQGGFHLDVVSRRLACPEGLRQVSLIHQNLSQDPRYIMVYDVGGFTPGEARQIVVFRMDCGVVANPALPVFAAEGGERRVQVGEELEDLLCECNISFPGTCSH